MIYNVISTFFSPIYLYHSVTYNETNYPKLNSSIHDVNYDEVCSQLRDLSKNMDFVSIDEWFETKNKKGIATITFDDAYLNIFEGIIRELITLNIPSTVFLIGKSLDNKLHWREKVVFLINNDLLKKFEEYLISINNNSLMIDFKKFYSSTKAKNVSSILIEKYIDEFLLENNINIKSKLISSSTDLVSNKYVTYGNHSYNHYLLSTLDYDKQFFEIKTGLDKLVEEKLNFTKTFSVPFGGVQSINKDSLKIFEKLSIKNVLLTTNSFQPIKNDIKELNIAYRYLPINQNKNKYKLAISVLKSFKNFF